MTGVQTCALPIFQSSQAVLPIPDCLKLRTARFSSALRAHDEAFYNFFPVRIQAKTKLQLERIIKLKSRRKVDLAELKRALDPVAILVQFEMTILAEASRRVIGSVSKSVILHRFFNSVGLRLALPLGDSSLALAAGAALRASACVSAAGLIHRDCKMPPHFLSAIIP